METWSKGLEGERGLQAWGWKVPEINDTDKAGEHLCLTLWGSKELFLWTLLWLFVFVAQSSSFWMQVQLHYMFTVCITTPNTSNIVFMGKDVKF